LKTEAERLKYKIDLMAAVTLTVIM